MAKALYMDDSYLKEFQATVVSVKDTFVVLDQTAFFPKGGGVDHDTGTMTRVSDNKVFQVKYVGKFNDEISHQVDQTGLQEGDVVQCKLDWDRRYLLMRYHTAAHTISGIFSKDGLKFTGGNLTIDKGRLDINLDEMDLDYIKQMFDKANDAIAKDYPVEIYYKTMEEAKKDPDLFKLAIGFPHDIDTIRIVDIKGFDAQADGGCHVASLKEIGKIVFDKAQNKGKNNRRMYFHVEP